MQPLRFFSEEDLNRVADLGLERSIVKHKEWINEYRCKIACLSPPYVQYSSCKNPKSCQVAWDWLWADGVRVGLLHPYQPKVDWDLGYSLSRSSGKVPFLCAHCHDASYKALATRGVSLNEESKMNKRFADHIAEKFWLISKKPKKDQDQADA